MDELIPEQEVRMMCLQTATDYALTYMSLHPSFDYTPKEILTLANEYYQYIMDGQVINKSQLN